ncbi:GMC oxidoreductase [Metabacillus sp. Hm71]|uniref:GMC oxidoreductase n=1 Tax=Metabacillus sp. Hm71 TaxID=3450743 RepID=UPI003F42062C
MKIYIADVGETLRSIAYKMNVKIDMIQLLNPHIMGLDLNITGKPINLPQEDQVNIPICPPIKPLEYLDHWIPLTPLEQMAETEYDVIIVGTGAGGGAVLWRLCEQWRRNGKRVAVVERGDLLLPTHSWNIPTFNSERLVQYFENPNITYQFGQLLPDFPGARLVFALGGRTLFWGTASPRMHSSEFSEWPVTEEEMELYYNIAEEAMNVTSDFTKDSSFTEVLLDRLRKNGFPEADYLPRAVDLQQTKYGELHSNVAFSSILFLAKALNQRPFDLAVKARAVQVLTEKGQVVGVKVMNPEKKSFILKGKNVVLSASSLETPRLLLHSGISGRAIGHYLTNHSFLLARGTINTEKFPEVLGAVAILVPYSKDRPYQLQLGGPLGYDWYHYKEKPRLNIWDIGFYGAFGKVESRFENQVTLDPIRRDEYGVPIIQVHFSYSDKDKAVIRQMELAMRQASNAMGIYLAAPDGLPEICLMPPGADFHESGTCRMGEDPATSATNRYGQIHGISGLFVADNSVLPSNGAANVTLTTVALAIRTADYIVSQLK